MSLTFTDGRAVVDLGDGRSLSILNPERTAYIEANLDPLTQMMGNLLGLEPGARADDESYEVAIIATEDERCQMAVEPAFAAYHDTEISSSAWTIYSRVPLAVIEAYIQAVRVDG